MPELLEDYKAQHGRLVSQARELERLREQVRSSAEREAAAIVTNARRNVRQVLIDARRELLVLVAQLQAVGCDQPPDGSARMVMEGELTSSPAALTSSVEPSAADELPPGSSIAAVARRDVREVLLEAQAELIALAEEARELRARIARQHDGRPQVAAPEDTPAVAPPSEEQRVGPESKPAWASQDFSAGRVEPAAPSAEYVPLAAGPRMWIPVAAGIALAALGATLYLWSGRASARIDAAGDAAETQPSASGGSAEAGRAATTASPAVLDRSKLSVKIDVRRPAWIRTTIDGRSDTGRVYKPGESRTVTANQEIVMRAGDAGAVLVSVDGSEAKPLGPDGRVLTRRFGQAATPKPEMLQTALPNEALPPAPLSGNPAVDVGTTGRAESPVRALTAAAEREILRVTQQWFEAYFAGNSVGMNDIATPEFQLVDERGGEPPVPPTMRGVERGLQQVRIELAGDGAVMSARLVERATVDGQLREFVSLVSGVWIRAEGRWRLASLRFVNPARIGN